MNSFDCTIYSTGKIDIEDLRLRVCSLLNAKMTTLTFLETELFELSIRANDEHDPLMESEFPDGFLYFKFIIEVEFKSNYQSIRYSNHVSKILEWLWSIGMPAIASCDYEDLLPNNGGYKSTVLPWPGKYGKFGDFTTPPTGTGV